MKNIKEEIEDLISERIYTGLALLAGDKNLIDVMQMIFGDYVYDLVWNGNLLDDYPNKKYLINLAVIEAITEIDQDKIVDILVDLMDLNLITLDYAPYDNYHMTVNREVFGQVYDEYTNIINRK